MKRRTVLKSFALAASAAMLVPSCISDPKKVSIALNNLKVTGDDEELVALIASTLIPATDKPGAREVDAHLYAFVMMDDCSTIEMKQKFMTCLQSFDDFCKKTFGSRFSDATLEDRLKMLSRFERKEVENTDLTEFYFVSKNLIVDGYRNSQYFLTKVQPYQLVPGPDFKGCVSVKNQTS